MMKKKIRVSQIIWLVCMAVVILPHQVSATTKTKYVTLDLNRGYITTKRPSGLTKAKKVSVKSSKKSVATVGYSKKKGDRRVNIVGKKVGKTTITVKCQYKNRRTTTYKYKVTVVKKHVKTALEKGKEAFQMQNQLRKEAGVSTLQWSDELYQFCLYRMKTSGYDKHANLGKDMNSYFGNFAGFKSLLFGENMTCDTSAKEAMKSWKNSPGHYRNLLASSHICGAIATYKGMWFAVFYDKDSSELKNWKSYHIKEIVVKRYNTTTGAAIAGSSIGYYENDNRSGSLKTDRISKAEGKSIYLEIGKTYVIYETIRPSGYEKAKSVTITVTEDGASEVVLTSEPSTN